MPQISLGVGRSPAALPPCSAVVSSRMMSLHRSMHSSQMNTDGPAMSFFTSCWLFPQNEQYNCFSLPLFLSDIVRLRGHSEASRIYRATPSGVLTPLGEHFVDQSVVDGRLRRKEVVAIGVALDALDRLAGVFCQHLVEPLLQV